MVISSVLSCAPVVRVFKAPLERTNAVEHLVDDADVTLETNAGECAAFFLSTPSKRRRLRRARYRVLVQMDSRNFADRALGHYSGPQTWVYVHESE